MFLENLALSRTTSHGFLASCQNFEKTNDTIPRKLPDRRKDGQTLFHRTLMANAGGPKIAKTWKHQNFLYHMKKEYKNNLNLLLINMV